MKFSRILTLLGIILFSSLAVFSVLYALDPANFRKKEIKNKISVNLNQNSGIIYHSANNSILNSGNNKKTNEGEKNLQWIKLTDSAPWEPRDSGVAFVFQNKIWLAGGLNGNKKVSENHTIKYWLAPHFNDIWSTEDGISWNMESAKSAWNERRSMTVAFFKNKLWMLGGWSPKDGYANDIWTSDDGVNWERIVLKAEWEPVEGHTLEVFKDKLWIIGGVNYDKHQTKNDVWYSENGINWTKVQNIPWKPRWDHATEVFNGKLFLAGGMDLEGKVFNDIWSTEDGINWKLVTETPPWKERQGHSLISYRNYLWIIGRLNDSEYGGVNDVWFSKDGTHWEKTKNDPEWSGREDFFSVVFKNKIWVFGGMDANWKWKNDVWVSELSNE